MLILYKIGIVINVSSRISQGELSAKCVKIRGIIIVE
jgi:hypothetical protein